MLVLNFFFKPDFYLNTLQSNRKIIYKNRKHTEKQETADDTHPSMQTT